MTNEQIYEYLKNLYIKLNPSEDTVISLKTVSMLYKDVDKSILRSKLELRYLLIHGYQDTYDSMFCKVCGNRVNFDTNRHTFRVYCSCKCLMNDPDIINKKRNTEQLKSLEEQQAIKKRRVITYRKTCNEKYGVSNTGGLALSLDKANRKHIERYGSIEKFTQEHLKLAKITNEIKYGGNPFSNEAIKEKIKSTNIKKYGYAYNMQNTDIKNRAIATRTKHKNENKLDTQTVSIEDIAKLLNQKADTIEKAIHTLDLMAYTNKNYSNILYFDISKIYILENYFITTANAGTSFKEQEIKDYIKSIYSGTIVENTRDIISPKELDIFIPDKKVAIEFDGLYYHSGKDRKYHLNKTIECEKQGIRLIHIFEDEWATKKEICKSIIASSLGIYKAKYFARKCTIVSIPIEQYRDFMNTNHIQGYTQADTMIGLSYDNEIIQAMGITRSKHKNGEIELNRMATKLNYECLGGFSRLITHIGGLYKGIPIYSYISRRMFDGKGYVKSGFTVVSCNNPTYFYVRGINRYPRYLFTKSRIKKQYEKGSLSYWNSTETEETNMSKNGYTRIWDCGTIKVCYN